jgi:FkbM family methyltransferase
MVVKLFKKRNFQKWFKLFTFKEIIFLSAGKILEYLRKLVKYNDYYSPLKSEIDSLLIRNINLIRKNNILFVHNYVVTDTEKCSFALRQLSSDVAVFFQIIENCEYKAVIDVVQKYLKNNNLIIVDLGSNIGLSVLYFKCHFPSSKIYSVESDRNNFQHQLLNIKLNHYQNVSLINRAIWSESSNNLIVVDDFRDQSNWSKRVVEISDLKNESLDKVQGTTLEQIISEFVGFNNKIDILKVDIEGSEAILFNDPKFNDILVNYVKIIAVEIHEEFISKEFIINELVKLKFEVAVDSETTIFVNKNLL